MKKTLNTIAQTIYDKKGANIIALDVKGISTLTDYLLIAEGTVDRHVKALSNAVIDLLQEQGVKPIVTEGLQEGDWVVLDYGNFVIHFFTHELRERYSLEEVWSKGKIIDLDIKMDMTS
jgi:ribosome-associated protein